VTSTERVVTGVSFDVVYRREIRRLVGLATLLSGNRSAGEDIAQEAFAVAYRRWEEVGRLDDPAGWVRRVVVNQSVSSIRRRMVEVRAVARLGRQRSEATLPEMSAEAEELWATVGRLPRRQVQVIVLHYAERMTLSEIATLLGCSKESVNTHLRRGRQTLAEQLEKEQR
jgi:RNA polymerase sigma factor (sigma-70 family)